MCQTRLANSSSGQSWASACTSCGRAMVTAPASVGSVSTRMAPSSAAGSCSGRHTRSKNLDSGRKASFTEMSYPLGSSSSCSTGLPTRVAKMSLGSSSTGNRLVVANAAPVSMFADPGPIGRGAGQYLQTVARLGESGRRMHHALLVAGQVVRQVGLSGGCGLQQGLPDAGHVAVAEDAEASGNQPLLHPVALAVLLSQEAHHRLRHRQPYRCHDFLVDCGCL